VRGEGTGRTDSPRFQGEYASMGPLGGSRCTCLPK
jgi:hypothetical protein